MFGQQGGMFGQRPNTGGGVQPNTGGTQLNTSARSNRIRINNGYAKGVRVPFSSRRDMNSTSSTQAQQSIVRLNLRSQTQLTQQWQLHKQWRIALRAGKKTTVPQSQAGGTTPPTNANSKKPNNAALPTNANSKKPNNNGGMTIQPVGMQAPSPR